MKTQEIEVMKIKFINSLYKKKTNSGSSSYGLEH